MNQQARVDTEVRMLLEAIYQEFGYDFRGYSRAHAKRRILQRMRLSGAESVSMLQHRVLHEKAFIQHLIDDFSIGVTEMFRDPDFFLALREKVAPLLQTWSYLKVWHAGCSTGEEVYSLAILLIEEGLYDRTQIYATDFNETALTKGREGIFSADSMRRYSRNYQRSGARGDFSDYYHAGYDCAIIDSAVKKNIVWANHNLVTDTVFGEMQLVVCRNVLIYFDRDLQNRAHRVFHDSLSNGGILCLGRKESLGSTASKDDYTAIDQLQKIYKKIPGTTKTEAAGDARR